MKPPHVPSNRSISMPAAIETDSLPELMGIWTPHATSRREDSYLRSNPDIGTRSRLLLYHWYTNPGPWIHLVTITNEGTILAIYSHDAISPVPVDELILLTRWGKEHCSLIDIIDDQVLDQVFGAMTTCRHVYIALYAVVSVDVADHCVLSIH